MNQVVIEIKDLGKRFGSDWVLSRLDFQVRGGESIALFGRNGSGKSTLLKMIATLIPFSRGALKVFGLNVRDEKREIRNRIRFLGHERQLYEMLTVMENIKLAATIRGISMTSEDSFRPILERTGVWSYRHRRVAELSEGMKKRVVLARLLLGSFDLVLLDEPHPTLDQEAKEILNQLIQEWKREGKTILIASHDHEQALKFADRQVVLSQGRLV